MSFHIICILFSVSSKSFAPTKVTIAKQSNIYNKKLHIRKKNFLLRTIAQNGRNVEFIDKLQTISRTDDILDDSEPDSRACESGGSESLYISCVLPPGPKVMANKAANGYKRNINFLNSL